jgi:hypothetical protein
MSASAKNTMRRTRRMALGRGGGDGMSMLVGMRIVREVSGC